MGQKKKNKNKKKNQTGLDAVRAVNMSETPNSSAKAGWSKGWGTKIIGKEKILETNN